MDRNAVRWFEIYVQDMNRAKAFYEAVLKVELQSIGGPGREMWRFPTQVGQSGSGGALVKAEGVTSGGNSTIVYFASDDCAVEASLAEQHGGRVETPKMAVGPFGFIALVHDPDGNMIGLHSTQ